MKSRYVFAGIVTIALVLVSIALLQVVSADNPGGSDKTWDGEGGNLDWGTAANWSPDGVPGTSNKVYLNAGAGVTISSGDQSITWLHSDRPITISGGSLTLAQDSAIESSLALSSDLAGTGNLTISGLFTWSGGQLRGSGSTTANGGISITGTGSKQLWDRTLNNGNNGTCTYDGSNFGLYLSSFNNQAGATFNLPTDGTIGTIAGGTFNNSGTFNRTTTSGTATIQVVFNNSGTVNVQSGTLRPETNAGPTPACSTCHRGPY